MRATRLSPTIGGGRVGDAELRARRRQQVGDAQRRGARGLHGLLARGGPRREQRASGGRSRCPGGPAGARRAWPEGHRRAAQRDGRRVARPKTWVPSDRDARDRDAGRGGGADLHGGALAGRASAARRRRRPARSGGCPGRGSRSRGGSPSARGRNSRQGRALGDVAERLGRAPVAARRPPRAGLHADLGAVLGAGLALADEVRAGAEHQALRGLLRSARALRAISSWLRPSSSRRSERVPLGLGQRGDVLEQTRARRRGARRTPPARVPAGAVSTRVRLPRRRAAPTRP